LYIEPHGLLDGTGISNIVLNLVADIIQQQGYNLILFVTRPRTTADVKPNVNITKQLFPTVPIVIVQTGADEDDIRLFNEKPLTDLFCPERKVGFVFGTFKNNNTLGHLIPDSVNRLKAEITKYISPKPIFEHDLKARIGEFINTTIGGMLNIWKGSVNLISKWNRMSENDKRVYLSCVDGNRGSGAGGGSDGVGSGSRGGGGSVVDS
jgi:hypothetical protein